jgi:predicted ATPase
MDKKCINMNRYILTGMPGCGKTSVIKALESQGYTVVHEAATDIVAAEQALGNPKPWRSEAFIDKIVALQNQRQQKADGLQTFAVF